MTSLTRDFIRFRLPAVLWACIIFALSSIPASRLPDFAILTFDKLIHIGIFFVFGVFMYRALRRKGEGSGFNIKRALIVVGLVTSYGILDELHQGLVPGRSLDVYDMMADTLGGILAVVLLYAAASWRRKRISVSGG